MNKNLVLCNSSLPVLPSPSDFPSYARASNAVPMLSQEEEDTLLKLWDSKKDPEAVKILVMSHLRLVVKVVKNHHNYGLPLGDLAQEGTIGLMKAVQKFKREFGVRFATYALRWVEAEIREYIFKNWRMIRLSGSSAMKKLFFGYRKTVLELQKSGDKRQVPTQDIAAALELSEDQVRLVESYFKGGDISLMASSENEDDEYSNDAYKLKSLPSIEETPETGLVLYSQEKAVHDSVHNALHSLNEREQDIVRSRMLESPPVGLMELGNKWGISAERVRQVEVQAIKKLQKKLKDVYEQELES